jgi:hypothetical protein
MKKESRLGLIRCGKLKVPTPLHTWGRWQSLLPNHILRLTDVN